MKIHQGMAAFALMASAVSQPALAEIVHIKLTGLFTIGDRRGQDFAIDLRYDSDASSSAVGDVRTFEDAGDIMLFTIGDRRSDAALLNARAVAVPSYVSTVFDLGPPRAVIVQTANGRTVTFSDPSGTLGTISFLFGPNPPPDLTKGLPTFAELAASRGGVVTFNGNGQYGEGTFTYAPFSAGVPEPATWGMMILGFGLVGAAMRMRRRKVAVFYA